jgi:hypothetical protein
MTQWFNWIYLIFVFISILGLVITIAKKNEKPGFFIGYLLTFIISLIIIIGTAIIGKYTETNMKTILLYMNIIFSIGSLTALLLYFFTDDESSDKNYNNHGSYDDEPMTIPEKRENGSDERDDKNHAQQTIVARTKVTLATLTVKEAGRQVVEHKIDKERVKVGREKTSDIILENDYVSGEHFKIVFDEGVFRIYDLGSKNGTFIKHKVSLDGEFGEKIKVEAPEILKDGDIIILADEEVKIEFRKSSLNKIK